MGAQSVQNPQGILADQVGIVARTTAESRRYVQARPQSNRALVTSARLERLDLSPELVDLFLGILVLGFKLPF